ncbi:aspartate/glutamate racemase family protein [Aminithiophilus ramosus]|uniref:Aspartate/glutamate racemase family protein n=2 Tax=Synergistales TaxID=649776 RepID=A0A9Q7EUP3_9BACT|nr:aspartate/glutamate racemase family protein [Aminithiophilus ramosus]QTX31838.1 aspartate/glutamate racemase family protein [Aminithiophilus ramosus]QVL35661.1 aspartate/glutamate racemase family protein [Synergistota bacterium]
MERKERLAKMKIKCIMPDKAMDRDTLNKREIMLKKVLAPDVEVSVDCIKHGPDELDCYTDEAFAASEMVKEAILAEKAGYNAIVTYCFSDIGLDAIRENVSVPVIGPFETTLSAAGMLCNRFTVITTEKRNVPRTYRRLMKNAIAREKLKTVKSLDIPIGELRTRPDAALLYLTKTCKEAIAEGADGIILGCLGMAMYSEEIKNKLNINIFNPALLAAAYAELCVRTAMTHSESNYPKFTNASNIRMED